MQRTRPATDTQVAEAQARMVEIGERVTVLRRGLPWRSSRMMLRLQRMRRPLMGIKMTLTSGDGVIGMRCAETPRVWLTSVVSVAGWGLTGVSCSVPVGVPGHLSKGIGMRDSCARAAESAALPCGGGCPETSEPVAECDRADLCLLSSGAISRTSRRRTPSSGPSAT